MTFHAAIEALRQARPDAPIGATALAGQYYDRAVGITDYERRNETEYVGHGINGKEMWVYYSQAKNVICCGDKDS